MARIRACRELYVSSPECPLSLEPAPAQQPSAALARHSAKSTSPVPVVPQPKPHLSLLSVLSTPPTTHPKANIHRSPVSLPSIPRKHLSTAARAGAVLCLPAATVQTDSTLLTMPHAPHPHKHPPHPHYSRTDVPSTVPPPHLQQLVVFLHPLLLSSEVSPSVAAAEYLSHLAQSSPTPNKPAAHTPDPPLATAFRKTLAPPAYPAPLLAAQYLHTLSPSKLSFPYLSLPKALAAQTPAKANNSPPSPHHPTTTSAAPAPRCTPATSQAPQSPPANSPPSAALNTPHHDS